MARRPRSNGSPADSSRVIEHLESAFEGRAIVYATSKRAPPQLFATKIAPDVLPVLGKHLDGIRRVKKIVLVLHTQGGTLDTPWPFVSLLRHHITESLYVVVPEMALSAGTLIALGADRIIMSPHAFLSPVDPARVAEVEGKTQELSIEDVRGYLDFVTERVGIRDQEALVEALKELTREVKATVLGNIHRTNALIERLSTSLLQLHLRNLDDENRVKQIVDFLTHSLHTHQHLIPIGEARDLIGFGDMVRETLPKEELAAREALGYIVKELELEQGFPPEFPEAKPAAKTPSSQTPSSQTPVSQTPAGQTPAGQTPKVHEFEAKRAIMLSRGLVHAFTSKYRLSKSGDAPIEVGLTAQGAWRRIDK